MRLGRSPKLIRHLRRRLLGAQSLPLFDAVQYRKNFERSTLVMSDMRRFHHCDGNDDSSSRRRSVMNLVVAPALTRVRTSN